MTTRAAAIVVVLSSLAVYALRESSALVAPVFVSLLMAYALEPLVETIMRARVSRIGAALITYVLLAVVVGSLTRQTVAQLDAFLDDLPGAVANATRLWQNASNGAPSPLSTIQRAATELDGAVGAVPEPPPSGVRRVLDVPPPFDVNALVKTIGASAILTGSQAAVVGVLSFLMICAGDVYKRKLVALGGPAFERRRLTVEVIRAIDRQIQRYLVVRLLISGIVAAATAIGLWWIGLAHAAVWGVVAGVLNVLPFIGPTVAIAAITAATFLQFQTAAPTFGAFAVAAVVAAIEGNVITPTLTSRAGEINTVAVFVSVLFWGWLWGVAGLLLAIPIMVAIKAAADHVEPLQPFGELLGL